MQFHRFYKKSFEDPLIRFSQKWGINQESLAYAYKWIIGNGGTIPDIQYFFYNFCNGRIIKRWQIQTFLRACNKYKKLRYTSLKKTQLVSPEFKKEANTRSRIDSLLDEDI